MHVVHAGPTKEATLAAFAEALDFPAWFGGNLDALADCLGHLARTAEGEWELVVDGVADARPRGPVRVRRAERPARRGRPVAPPLPRHRRRPLTMAP